MSSQSPAPALALDFPAEPVVIGVARTLAALIGAGEAITTSVLRQTLTAHFGGTDAAGRWSVRDAHAALELAQVLYLHECDEFHIDMVASIADAMFARIADFVPTQSMRSEEQIELQQFATPPRLSWLAARACGIAPGELVLEPSAGTGMLAVWAAKASARLALNEISPQRRECLEVLFAAASVTDCDAELIDELLDPAVSPSVVLMNPPYSHSVERRHDSRTGDRHLRSAWSRLAQGGRLVAIMPEWFDIGRFVASAGPASLLLNAAIERGFTRQGTSITTRLLVLDKVASASDPSIVRGAEFADLASMIDALPRGQSHPSVARASVPSRTPFQLVTAAKRPIPLTLKRPAPATTISPVAYEALETPAPIAEQTGHYLPYRPSRIAIAAAAEHPTPLVESVAMGSIFAPMPCGNPQLPDGIIARGDLSAAQAETLIYVASAHARDLPGRFEAEDKGCALKASAEGATYRQGYFLGDGTGAGKGRQVASVILDRWVRGERRHIWISKNEALLEDARRDWTALGGLPIDIQPLSSWKLGSPIGMRDGILFATYPTLRSGRVDATRLDQILAWAGDDFDGVIVFDEAHAMANAAGGEGSRGKVKGSEQGVAGVRLQNMLPRARVLYASATGASDVNNLAYATRLGLWGPETAFANREAFVADIRGGGIAAMELVARDLKSLGLYTARALSFAGVEYDSRVDHRKVSFKNRYGLTLSGDLYLPKERGAGRLPALAISGPFGAIKEQSSGLYAQTMAERGFAAIAFDPSYTGESGGQPRNVASPDINTEDFSAAVDYLGLQLFVDRERIGVIGICGWGGMALNAVAVDKRVKAVVAVTMYDMTRVMSKGYNDSVTLEERTKTLEQLSRQRWQDAERGTPAYGPPMNELKGGEAQFLVDYHDYYKTPRGFHPRSVNSNASWTVTNPLSFMNMPLLSYIKEIAPRPMLLIHGEKAHSRYFSETAFAAAAEPKELVIIPGANHVDLYDRKDKIPFDRIAEFFGRSL